MSFTMIVGNPRFVSRLPRSTLMFIVRHQSSIRRLPLRSTVYELYGPRRQASAEYSTVPLPYVYVYAVVIIFA
jgi:hypothetical protein